MRHVTLLFNRGDAGDVGIAITGPMRAMSTSRFHECTIFAKYAFRFLKWYRFPMQSKITTQIRVDVAIPRGIVLDLQYNSEVWLI